jgi:predicted ATPase
VVQASIRRERCVVVIGPGGVGKTRLAQAAALRMSARYRDGVAVVELGDLPPEGTDVRQSIERLRALVRAVAGRPEDAADSGDADPQLLLVIDNAEHVVKSTTVLTQELLDESAGLHLIVTSRRPLSTPSAPVWEVGPLGFNDVGERPEAVTLFLRRVQSACPTLDLSDRLEDVRELCARLDGMPLALELAAHRLRSVSLDALLREESVSQMLHSARTPGMRQQRTLSDTVRRSYALLDRGERALLRYLSHFVGPFTLDDVKQHDLDGHSVAGLVGRLSELVDSSLVQVRRGPQYTYWLHGYVREFVRSLGEGDVASLWMPEPY